MTPEEKEEYEATARFVRQAIKHISKATNAQKKALLKVLLERPPEIDAIEMAEASTAGLTEKEFLTFCSRIQKTFDPDFWEFATRKRK